VTIVELIKFSRKIAATCACKNWYYIASNIVVGRYTEIPNGYPIFSNTDTDADISILNTENSVRYSPPGAVNCVTFETGQLNQSYRPLMFSAIRNNIGY